MTICSICRFKTEWDDVVIGGNAGHCVCLRCYTQETGSVKPFPRALRREVVAVLAGRCDGRCSGWCRSCAPA